MSTTDPLLRMSLESSQVELGFQLVVLSLDVFQSALCAVDLILHALAFAIGEERRGVREGGARVEVGNSEGKLLNFGAVS